MRAYLVSLILAAFLCGTLSEIVRIPALQQLVKMACGLVLTIAILGPLRSVELTLPELCLPESAERIVAEGEAISKTALEGIIKAKAEAYILDKAAEWDATVTAVVTLDGGDPPLPESAEICGDLSPNTKRCLEELISSQLGIAKENLTWTGTP